MNGLTSNPTGSQINNLTRIRAARIVSDHAAINTLAVSSLQLSGLVIDNVEPNGILVTNNLLEVDTLGRPSTGLFLFHNGTSAAGNISYRHIEGSQLSPTLSTGYISSTNIYAENLQVSSLTVTNEYISALVVSSLNVDHATISGNLIVNGSLSVVGDFIVTNTDVQVTQQVQITNSGTGPALIVTQSGANDIATFNDDATPMLRLLNGGLTSITQLYTPIGTITSLSATSLSTTNLRVTTTGIIPTLSSTNISATAANIQTLSSTNISVSNLYSNNISVSDITVRGNSFIYNTAGSLCAHTFTYSIGGIPAELYHDTDTRRISTTIFRQANHDTLTYNRYMVINHAGLVTFLNATTPSLTVTSFASVASALIPTLSTTSLSATNLTVTTGARIPSLSVTSLSATNITVTTGAIIPTLSVNSLSATNLTVTTSAIIPTLSVANLSTTSLSASSVGTTRLGINITADSLNALRVQGHTAMGTTTSYTSLATTSRVLDVCYGPVSSYTINTAVATSSDIAAFINANGNDSNANRYVSYNLQVTGQHNDERDLCRGDIIYTREVDNEPGGAYILRTRTNNTASYDYRDIARFGYSSCYISPGNNGPIVIGSQSANTAGYNLCIGTPSGGTQTLELGVISTLIRGALITEGGISVGGLLSAASAQLTNISITTASITTLYNTTASITSAYTSITTAGQIYDLCGGSANETKRGAFSHYTLTSSASYLRIYITEGSTAFTSGAAIVMHVNIGLGSNYGPSPAWHFGSRAIDFRVSLYPWQDPIGGAWSAFYQPTSSTPNTTDDGSPPFTGSAAYGTATTGTSSGYRWVSLSVNLGLTSGSTYTCRCSVEVTGERGTVSLIDIQNTTS